MKNCERKKHKLRAANKITAAIETRPSVVQVGKATQATSRVFYAETAEQRSLDQDRISANRDMADVAVMEHPQGPRMGNTWNKIIFLCRGRNESGQPQLGRLNENWSEDGRSRVNTWV